MYQVLAFLIIALFIGVLFINIYFRVKVLKVYKRLVQAQVQFDAKDVFNMDYVEQTIIPKYPQHANDIRTFMNHIRYSVRLASVLVALITLFGAVLMWYR